MNRFVAIALVSVAAGCGFPLTPGAVSCGNHAGMDVYVDGKGLRENNAPFMTCDQAFATIDLARGIGASHGMWVDKSSKFLEGMRLEFIGDENLKAIGEENKWGYTVNSPFAHDMAVVYSQDNGTGYQFFPDVKLGTELDPTDFPARGDPLYANRTWTSASILAHEMIHVLQTDSTLNISVLNTHTDKHCHWSETVAPRFSDLGWAQYGSNFIDACDQKSCSGSSCSAEVK